MIEVAGWGVSGPVTLADGTQAFGKRLPLTDVEAAHPRSTKNHFRLPTYYSYGVGSEGFGAWRELAVHERVSGFVGFPMLVEWDVRDRTPGDAPSWSASCDEYVAYWNGNEAVGRFWMARATATSEIALVLENCGDVGVQWLLAHQNEADGFLTEVLDAVDALSDLDVVHFDAHLGNVVVSDRVRLTDFGLSMAADLELSADERRFFDRHRHYDAGTVLASLGQMLMGALGTQRPADLARAIEERAVPYAPELWAVYDRFRAPMLYMVEHFARMMRPAKRSTYDDAELARLLCTAGKISR